MTAMILFLLVLIALLVAACAFFLLTLWRLRRERRIAREETDALHAELERIQGEARRLETVRRDFVANISHELRTPLASIKLLVETLESGALDDDEMALNFTHKIGEETDYLIDMAGELLQLARLEAAPALQLRARDPATMVMETVERMRALARNKKVALRVELSPRLPAVWADDEQVGRVIVNLLNNAITFTPRGGAVLVQACANEHDVRISVLDTGPGIPGGEETRIFERFYKADTARQRGGAGLGLSIARHIIEAHGGRIWAANKDSGGACLTFTLPVAGGD